MNPRSPPVASIALGLAVVATLAVAATAMRAGSAVAAGGEGPPVPACRVPVALRLQGATLLACNDADRPVRPGCGPLVGGDAVALPDCTVEPGGMPPAMRLLVGLPLDLNRASAEALQLLTGIGPHLAAAIVADRQARGPFASVEALARVSGVGVKTVERLRSSLTVEGAASLPR